MPAGDIAGVIDLALDALVQQLEKRKFAATSKPRVKREAEASPTATDESTEPAPFRRYIPRAVRRAVWIRDGGQCTHVSPDGRRCEERADLEYDHVEPVARGGTSTVDGLQLRCRPHNQYAAERVFGIEFMKRKREEAREARRASG